MRLLLVAYIDVSSWPVGAGEFAISTPPLTGPVAVDGDSDYRLHTRSGNNGTSQPPVNSHPKRTGKTLNLMKPISITIQPERIIQVACGLITLYLFFAFFPLPRAIDIGLDPSWKYGISQLAENNVIFGEDIIFTYGAFGYLVRGAVLESNFWDIFIFKTLVHGLLFAVTIWRIIKSKTVLEQLAIAISVSFPYLISDFYEALQTEYQTLYIIVILLSFREIWQGKNAHYWAIGIGAVGGFLLHSKVSMGLQASVSLFIFFAIQVLLGFRSRLGIRKNILLLLDSQLATGQYRLSLLTS